MCSVVPEIIFCRNEPLFCSVLKEYPVSLNTAVGGYRLSGQASFHRILYHIQIGDKFAIVKYRYLRSRRRCRSSQIRDIVRDRRVGLVAYSGDHRGSAFKYRTGYSLLVESPEILYGTAASSDNHNIYAEFIQCSDAPDNRRRCTLALDKRRIQINLHIWISSIGNILNITDCRAGRRCDDPDLHGIFRNRLFVTPVEHSHLLEVFFEFHELLIEKACAFKTDLSDVELVAPAFLIDIDRTAAYNIITVLHRESETFPVPREQYTGQRSGLIL